jgi:hypothetical protein
MLNDVDGEFLPRETADWLPEPKSAPAAVESDIAV